MKIVFLPGMDGTGLLFSELVKNMPQDMDHEVVCLNDIQGVSYRQQSKQIAEKIGPSNVILVAESYSGRIAYELCNILENRISKVIFIASFISCPSRLAKLAAVSPENFLKPHLFPNWLIKRLCFGGRGNRELSESVRRAISRVEPKLLKQRLKNMAELEAPSRYQLKEAVYIRPTNDYLVGREALQVLRKVYSELNIETVEGGHFIAQTAPESCARIILRAAVT